MLAAALPGGLALPTSAAADVLTGLSLDQPAVVHSTGAELRWRKPTLPATVSVVSGYSVFSGYQVYRSTDASFTPTPTTLIGTVGDETVTTFVDTTAGANTAFTYKVSANGQVSNGVTVTTPAPSQAVATISGTAVRDTYLEGVSGGSTCSQQANYGQAPAIRVGVSSTGTVDRGLLGFNLAPVPPGSTILSATLSLPYPAGSPAAAIDAHRVNIAWDEGSETGSCNQTGASWSQARRGSAWTSAGGDVDFAGPAASINHAATVAGADTADLTDVVQSWASGGAPDFGVELQVHDESTPTTTTYVDYASTDSGAGPSLVVHYTDNSQPVAPTVTIVQPSANAVLSGPSVPLTGDFRDDGRVVATTFTVDNQRVAAVDTAPFATTLNTTKLTDGVHTLTMTATDNAGQTSATSEQIFVDNAAAVRTVSMFFPEVPGPITGTAHLEADINTDVHLIAGVVLAVDGRTVYTARNADASTPRVCTEDHIPPVWCTPFGGNTPVTAPTQVSAWRFLMDWNTLDPHTGAFDGAHVLTATFIDVYGQVLSVATKPIVVANTAQTAFQSSATFGAGNTSLSDVISPVMVTSARPTNAPLAVDAAPVDSTGGASVPSTCPDDSYCPTATVTNTSGASWFGAQLWYRWINAHGDVTYQAPASGLPAVVPAGTATAVPVTINPPTLPNNVESAAMTLRLDVYATDSAAGTPKWFAAQGNAPAETVVTVRWKAAAPPGSDAATARLLPGVTIPQLCEFSIFDPCNRASRAATTSSSSSSLTPSAPTDPALGLERYYGYAQVPVGAGMTALTNVATGNLLVHWQPFSDPGLGLSSVFSLTYNSLEDHSDSPIGNNWSAAISTLTRLTEPLDIHPNKADQGSGHSAQWINFIDADGTPHTFTGVDGGNGAVGWRAPAGVHLYLRHFSDSDATKYWALSRPDHVTFFYTQAGWPTGASDANGNNLTFTLTKPPPGADPGKPGFEISKVTDAGGRSVSIDYYGQDAPAHVRGNVAAITDHGGHAITFAYYDDGNLLRITQVGDTSGSIGAAPAATRSFAFTYQNSSGSGPAIPAASDRVNPDPHTTNESSLLYSIRDPQGSETLISDFGPSDAPADRSLVHTITDRAGAVTSVSYNHSANTTSITAPGSRVTTYGFDAYGRPTSVTDPLNRVSALAWNSDNMLTRVTDPALQHRDYTYNANGAPLTISDELARTTTLTYDDRPLDSTDTGTHWSLLATKTSPAGTSTTSIPNDFQYTFSHDAAGNLTGVTDPTGHVASYCYNLTVAPACNPTNDAAHPGTIESVTDPNGGVSTFTSYDANGLPGQEADPLGRVTQYAFDTDGRNTFIQTPTHAVPANGDDAHNFRTYFYYDAFHRLGATSTPKDYTGAPGVLVWSSVVFDGNDNVVSSEAPTYGDPTGDPGNGPKTTANFDAMDRPTLTTGPDKTADPNGTRTRYSYDAAGRLVSVTDPNAAHAGASTPSVMFGYDADDDLVSQTVHNIDPATGADNGTRTAVYCYDNTGNKVAVYSPLAGLTSPPSTCPSAAAAHLTIARYDAAHQLTNVTEPLTATGVTAGTKSYVYDLDGNVHTVADENGNTTTVDHDQLDRTTRVDQPYNGAHHAVSVYQYDGNGNVVLQASPRGVDANSTHPNYAWYTTRYRYDADNELGIITEPVDGNTGQAYVYYGYDADGRPTTVTLPVNIAPNNASPRDISPAGGLAGMDPKAKTTTTYLDTGWVATAYTAPVPAIAYDYNARGQQTHRQIATTGTHDEFWTYLADGKLASVTDPSNNAISYSYDPDGHVTGGVSTYGISDVSQRTASTTTYDGYGEATKTTLIKNNVQPHLFNSYTYTDDGQLDTSRNAGKEDAAGTTTTAPDRISYGYDGADRLTTQTDFGIGTGCAGDQQIATSYTITGMRQQQTIGRAVSGCSGESTAASNYATKQTTAWTYLANNLLKTLTTTDAVGNVLQTRQAGYDDTNGYIDNGNLTSDAFALNGPDTTTPCRGTTPSCTTTYAFNARDQLISSNDGHGVTPTITTYTLDNYTSGDVGIRDGNVTKQVDTRGSSSTTTTRSYDGNQLQSQTTGSTSDFWYDQLGRLACVTTSVGSPADCQNEGTDANLLASYSYDPLDRITRYRSNDGSGNIKNTATYVYDANDRLTTENETRASGSIKNRTTNFDYLGLSGRTVNETQTSTVDCGGTLKTLTDIKTYTLDAGSRATLGDRNQGCADSAPPTAATTYDYSSNLRGDISLIDNETNSTGAATASYSYTPYGQEDDQAANTTALSKGDTLTGANALSPINPYRYAGKRIDTATGTLQTGDRRYDPVTSRYQTPDLFRGALDDLGLSADPINGNRYGLAEGNPVGFSETDGHIACASDYNGQTYCNGTGTQFAQALVRHDDALERADAARAESTGQSGQQAAATPQLAPTPGPNGPPDSGHALVGGTPVCSSDGVHCSGRVPLVLWTDNSGDLIKSFAIETAKVLPAVRPIRLLKLLRVAKLGAAAEDGMAGVRAAGSFGERSAGITKNTDHIPSLSDTAAYRIPDELNATTLGEVKNVGSLSYTNQLRDFSAYAQQEGLMFNLYVRGSTTLSGPLQDAVNSGLINLIRNLPG